MTNKAKAAFGGMTIAILICGSYFAVNNDSMPRDNLVKPNEFKIYVPEEIEQIEFSANYIVVPAEQETVKIDANQTEIHIEKDEAVCLNNWNSNLPKANTVKSAEIGDFSSLLKKIESKTTVNVPASTNQNSSYYQNMMREYYMKKDLPAKYRLQK